MNQVLPALRRTALPVRVSSGPLARAPMFDTAGHRVVYGGTRFHEAVVIDESVREELAGLADLEPEHMKPDVPDLSVLSAQVASSRAQLRSRQGTRVGQNHRAGQSSPVKPLQVDQIQAAGDMRQPGFPPGRFATSVEKLERT